jgi:DNA-directed RNA polymerase subunit M/transcription elongation factor TFIIS
MSTINEKQGLKPAGKRSMMKLPDDRELRNQLTRAQCPNCGRRGANLSRLRGNEGMFVCTWCQTAWRPE